MVGIYIYYIISIAYLLLVVPSLILWCQSSLIKASSPQLQAVQEQAKDGGNAARYEAHQCIPKDAPPMRFIGEVNSTCMT